MAKANVVPLKDVLKNGRIDAEYYHPDTVELLSILCEHTTETVGEFAYVTDGIHSSPDLAAHDNGVLYLSAKSVKNNEIIGRGLLRITYEQHLSNKRSQLCPKDIIISTVGTIGNSAVVTESLGKANCDRHLGIIRVHDEEYVSPFYVSAFLNSRYGKIQSVRESTGNVQLNLFISKIKNLKVPRLICENQVAELTETGIELIESAKTAISDLEHEMDRTVLEDRDLPVISKSYEATLAEVFGCNRLDAEYYQPAKREALELLSNDGGRPLTAHFDIVRRSFNPRKHQSNDRVFNYDLTDALEPFLDSERNFEEVGEIGSAKWVIREGDLVISRLRSYLKEVSLVVDQCPYPRVCSSEFIVLRPKEDGALSVGTALAFLRCAAVQLILNWSQDGSNHPRFSREELDRIVVPQRVVSRDEYFSDIIGGCIRGLKQGRSSIRQAVDYVEDEVEKVAG